MKVAIVGAGPAGTAAARDLASASVAVTVFEREREAGGLLRYGYPEARMPRRVSQRTTERLAALGVIWKFGCTLGKDISLPELEEEFDAVLLAVGATVPGRLGIPGEDLPGVYPALYFLHHARDDQPWPVGSHVIIVGGGDTSVDAATSALDHGATSATILYRGLAEQLRAQEREVSMARGMGVELRFETQLQQIAAKDGRLELTLHTPVGELLEDADTVIVAIGQTIDPGLLKATGLTANPDGTTSRPKVFATGEMVHGADLLAAAIKAGRGSAQQILAHLA